MRRYLKFSSLGVPGVYQIDGAGDFLLSIDDIVATANITTNTVVLLLTQPNGAGGPDSGTGISMRVTNSGLAANPGPVVYEAIISAITSAPGGNVDLNAFLPEGYAIQSWEYDTYIV